MKQSVLKALLFALFFGLINVIVAQTTANDPVLMTVAGDKVTKSEFLGIYQKNNVKGEVIDKKSMDEYLELFINFKLKVKEAEELGLDTLTSFKTELGGYRKQLAQNYLVDNEVNDELLKEAYDRMHTDLRASHILIKVDPGAAPADTLAAYNKIMGLRARIMGGESFAKVAKEESDDPSAKDREASGNRPFAKGNGGDLGYFTVFDMVYPFESAAYKLKKDEISLPVRTDYGFHLIKITDSKKAMGRVRAAHVFVQFPNNGTASDSLKAKNKIFEAYAKLKSGIEFDTITKQYSEDKTTATKGGILPWFGVNRMVPEFIQAVSKLEKVGSYSEPVTTSFGWHIIKIIEKKEIGSFEDSKAEIKQKVTRDSRSQRSKEAVVTKIRGSYGFKEFPKARTEFLGVMDTTLFAGKWEASKAEKLNAPLFILGDKTFTQKDFAKFLEKEQKVQAPEDYGIYLTNRYKKFTEESCISFKDSKLEQEFPDFRNLMKEYRDGILLFDLTDKKVWSKAVKDTLGLESFFNQNKSNYVWGERIEATTFKSKDKDIAKKAYKIAEKMISKGEYSQDDILNKANKENKSSLTAEKAKYSKGDNKFIDGLTWEKGITPISESDGSFVFVVIHQKLNGEPKNLSEARGLATADYQNFLEKEWIKSLHSKFPVQVDRDVFNTLK